MANKPVQFSLPDATFADLSALAQRLGVSNSELARHALDLYKFLKDQEAEGGEVFVRLNGETLRLVRL